MIHFSLIGTKVVVFYGVCKSSPNITDSVWMEG